MASSKKRKTKESEAHRRVEYILKVRSGLCTVIEAASELGVSRKSYYQWEAKAIDSMVEALVEKEPGRPALTPDDEEKRWLRKQLKERDKEIAQLEQRKNLIKEACKSRILMIKGQAEKKYGDENFA